MQTMAKTYSPTKKYFSRKGRIPTTFRITPELKAQLAERAEQVGMSFTAFTSLLMEQLVLQNKIEEALKKQKMN